MPKSSVNKIEDDRWQSLVDRDAEADGQFFYGVTTTGVFCRPGCSSRLPKRNNVLFFDSCEEAEQAGFRACKRCAPCSTPKDQDVDKKIVRACRSMEESEKPLKLEQLARQANLSPYHFHRLFKKKVGVTPKQYAQNLQARRFRQDLQSSPTVTDAIYSAGFSSSSGAYNKGKDRLGMHPRVYKNGAEGVAITYGIAECFLGWVIVAATEKGVCCIEFGDRPDALPDLLQKRFPKATLRLAGVAFSTIVEEVVKYIQKPVTGIHIPLDIQGTAFQQRVWEVLRRIRPGETMSYTEVAEKIGKPKAARAVATACAANTIAVVIPCHRVISKNGGLSGYRWGIERKRQLLDVESDS